MSESLLNIGVVADGVLQIKIDRPEVLNALNTRVLTLIAQELEHVKTDPSIRAIVLTGNERAFAAGADIHELEDAALGDFPEVERQSAWEIIRSFPKPLVAAVSGFALGGGCELMMAADIVVASRSAKIGQPEINLGIIPGAGGTQCLTRIVGKSIAMKMNLTGQLIGAEEAMRYGLVSEISEPELYLTRSIELASIIANKSPTAVKAVKTAVLNAYQTDLQQGLLDERSLFLEVITSSDAREGIKAFIEKRPAVFPSNSVVNEGQND